MLADNAIDWTAEWRLQGMQSHVFDAHRAWLGKLQRVDIDFLKGRLGRCGLDRCMGLIFRRSTRHQAPGVTLGGLLDVRRDIVHEQCGLATDDLLDAQA